MAKQRGIRIGGPLGPFRDGVREALGADGYSEGRISQILIVVAHLSLWLDERGLGPEELTVHLVEEFFAGWHVRHSWCRSPRSLSPVLAYLRWVGVVPAVEVTRAEPSAEDELLGAFRHYLIDQRGLTPATVESYAGYARACIRSWWPDGQIAVADLDAGDVITLVRSGVDSGHPPSLRAMVTALRSLLRFFHAAGMTSRSLVEAVPAMAAWPRAVLPASISSEESISLVKSCDTSTLIGLRDAAILNMLARLGLRACEVTRLGLDDIDWRAGVLRIRGKGRRIDELPLPADVGESLAAHLVVRRSSKGCRAVFVKVVAPYDSLSPSAVGGVVHFACDRAGLPRVGPHRLRHMVGTETLRAGAPLSEVAQLLRHAGVSTSTIYASPDPTSLVALAKPWPEVRR